MRTFIDKFSKYEKKRKRGIVITVSGLSGAGKTTVAEAIAKATGLTYVSAGEIFRKVAEERGIPLVQLVKKRNPELDFEVDRRTLEYAMKGNVVLDGRLTGWIAGDWADFRIWVRCKLQIRAKRVALRDKVSFDEAVKRIRMRDHADMRVYKKLYKIDLLDESIYDLIMDTSRLSYDLSKKIPQIFAEEILNEIKSKSGSKRKKARGN